MQEAVKDKVMEITRAYSYDLAHPFNYEKWIEAKCIVHFRPKDDWKGQDYGFDWMRLGPNFGDQQKYEDIVGKMCYNPELCGGKYIPMTDGNNSNNLAFHKDLIVYDRLQCDYRPLLIPWRHGSDSQYFCSWLSLYPATAGNFLQEFGFASPIASLPASSYISTKTEAELRLYLDIEEVPDYIEFEESEYFDITPKTISTGLKKGKGFWPGVGDKNTITIKCKKPLLEDTPIRVYAVQKDTNTDESEKRLAGKLWVWHNSIQYRKRKKIVMIRVKTPAMGQNEKQTGNCAGEQDRLKQYLAQSLIEPDGEIKEVFLDMSEDEQFKNYYVRPKIDSKLLLAYYDEKAVDNDKSLDFINLETFLYEKLLEQNHLSRTLYDNYIVIFYLAENGGDYTVQHKINQLPGYSKGHLIVAFGLKEANTAAHECYHALNLQHSFANFDSQGKESFCTYKSGNTENIMDYADEDDKNKPMYTLWHWQWKQANESIK